MAGNLFGGVEAALLAIARASVARGADDASFAICFDGRFRAEIEATGARVFALTPTRVRWPWQVKRTRAQLGELLAREAFDVVVCHGCWPHVVFAPAVRAAGAPLVFFAHDVVRGKHVLERLARRTPPDLAVANSRFTQATLGALFPGVASRVVHPPVPAPPSGDRAAIRARVRAALGTPDDAVVLVQTSRLEAWKGHGVLLDALGRLASDPRWACWIAGGVQRAREQPYLAALRAKVEALGIADRVRFLGERADVREILFAADVHCQPNVTPEPFGIALVEALYAGLPVVTSRMGGALEIVTDECGVLVPPGDAASLANALRALIDDRETRAHLGAAGPARAHAVADPARQIALLSGALAEAAREPASRVTGPARADEGA